MWNKRQSGVTLVELIIAMVIVSISLTAVVQIFVVNSVASADPMITKQMRSVAEGLMEEIQRQPFKSEPNGTPMAPCARDSFNDIADYNGYTQASVCDIEGTSLGLADMGVSVSVTPGAQAGAPFPGVPAADVLQIAVVVTQGSQTFRLVGWRTDYANGKSP
ncbi:prepilin-type N-terminal cleavage/methylation domain-containing protein [Pseudoduganella sp. LjRoot289]|uniref:type IV pilus modification PilV family protein n=1 Tax=Pseudoduganella sp. LjRoot289 TaxID=3342314 RepID=UPI003ECE033B